MIVTSSAERRSNRVATKIGGSGVIYRPSLGLNSSSSLLLPKIGSSDDSYERHSGRSANDWQSSRESVEPLLSCLLLVRVRRQLRFLTHDPTGRTLREIWDIPRAHNRTAVSVGPGGWLAVPTMPLQLPQQIRREDALVTQSGILADMLHFSHPDHGGADCSVR